MAVCGPQTSRRQEEKRTGLWRDSSNFASLAAAAGGSYGRKRRGDSVRHPSGRKGGDGPEMKELYQDQGIGHILAISGLHLSLIGLGAYRVLRRGTGSYLAGGAAGIGFLGLYVVMIGLSVSVVRAFLMFLFRIGADITGRHYDGLTALSFSAAAVLLWRPLSVYDGGFWLSFGAVLGLLLLLPLFQGLPCQGFWSSFCVNLVIFRFLPGISSSFLPGL